MLCLGLAAVIDQCKKIMKVGGRRRRSRNIIKAPMCRDIPEEILIEILVRLPAESLMRFKCVSRHWDSLISSRYFTNLFFTFSSSSTRRRVFMTMADKFHQIDYSDFMLFSSSLSNLDTTTTFLQLNHHLTFSGINNHMHFVSVLRGLMCFREGREIQIINVTTRQVLNLPLIKSNMLESRFRLKCFFCYDSVNDEYKVLITNWSLYSKERRYRSESQVLVLGTGASWRNTRSHTSPPPPHSTYTNGISINNVLYYGALTHGRILVLMSFDLNSEEFNQIELPIEARTLPRMRNSQLNLINYQGQVTLVYDFHLNTTACRLDLWVVEDAGKNKVSHKVFVLPCHQLKASLETEELLTRVTSGRGELLLSGRIVNRNRNTRYAIYNLETNRITREVVIESIYSKFSKFSKVVIESIYSKFSKYVDSMLSKYVETTLWDDVENIMYLEV